MGKNGKAQRRRNAPPPGTWWAEFEHPSFGTAKVIFRWERVAGVKGVFRVVVTGVEFDLFTPADEQKALIETIRETNVACAVGEDDRLGRPF